MISSRTLSAYGAMYVGVKISLSIADWMAASTMAARVSLGESESQVAGALRQRSATMQLLSRSLKRLEPNVVFGLTAQDHIHMSMFETDDNYTVRPMSLAPPSTTTPRLVVEARAQG